jgi:hypothetical protein
MRIALSKHTQPRLALTVILSFGLAPPGNPAWCAALSEESILTLYTPAKEDYLPEYERDRANGKIQTWDQYWGWVQAFYAGNLLSDGWTKHGEQSLAAIKSGENRRDLIEQYNELGKIVSREWAKDYAIRRITTADLRRWHEAVSEAVRTDDGSGDTIKKALDTIREQAEKKLPARPRVEGLTGSGLVGVSTPC